jgi:hypothetical protein
MAAGGILTRPTLALAGEAGAEAFVPLSGGAIPVSLTGGMKSQVHNYNINIQALDARSVRDLFNENPELILGVTEKSARNFRYSRRNRT